jgi:hypothetical protein
MERLVLPVDGMDNNERFLGGQKFYIPSGFVKI